VPTSLETLSNDLAAAVDAVGESVVAVHARRRIPSTGVLWRPGLVVAADHTVRTDDEVAITLAGAGEARGHVTGRDPTTDLCILQLAAGGSAPTGRPATIADGTVRVGEVALVVGRPGAELRAALGIVSATGPAWRTPSGGRVDQFIHLDVAVYDGFSGGPLVTAGGRVAGICTSGLARGAPIVVPATTVNRVVDALVSHGGVTRRGFLGIGTQLVTLPDAVRRELHPIGGHVPATGLMIVSVQSGTSADRAGMLLGDVLVRLGEDAIEDPRDVLAALGPESVGRDLRATVVRAGRPVDLTVTVTPHPSRT
jgi:S1-C subfamily serine protease